MLNLNCVICAELFTPSDDVHVTVCGHMFHYPCLKQWLERSKSCPQCRNKCTDRNIFRVYFNLANLDPSRVDVGLLQEQLDNTNLKIKMMEKDLKKSEEQVKGLKEIHTKCMKTIIGLEQELNKNKFIILSYSDQVKILKGEAKNVEDLRKEVKSLKQQIEAMESVSTMLTASSAESEKLLKTETDPKKLALWVSTFKRELRISESKRNDMRNMLKVVQNDLRKELGLKKVIEEQMSQLESDNYQLNEKIKELQSDSNREVNTSDSPSQHLKTKAKRATLSPTIKENIKKIEESNSPYLNIKSSSVGLVPLFQRHHENPADGSDGNTKRTTSKLATLKLSPTKYATSTNGTVRKTSSDLSEKYSIFKKPRIGFNTGMSTSADNANLLKPLGSNLVLTLGGSARLDRFSSRNMDDEILPGKEKEQSESATYQRQMATAIKEINPPIMLPKGGTTLSLSNRLKSGGLRNFKIPK